MALGGQSDSVTEPPVTISVIIPCFNAGPFVGQAIASVLAQTLPAHEIILVDDGSTDDSATVARSFGSRIRLLQQENGGVSQARNAGIAAATGDHLLFLDADDLLASHALEALAHSIADQPGAVALMGHACFQDDPEQPFEIKLPKARPFFPGMIASNIGMAHSWMFPAQIIRDVGGFRPDLRIFEDWECWCRVGLRDVPLRTVEYAGALYRRHPAAICLTAPLIKFLRGHVRVMQTLCEGLLPREDLPLEHREQLFWSTWVALERGRSGGLSPEELQPLARYLAPLSRRQASSNRFATAIRWLGPELAGSLRRMVVTEGTHEGPTIGRAMK